MVKNSHQTKSGHQPAKKSGPKALGGHVLTHRSVKSGRFSEGVKLVTKRDRAGLIKLADR